jgi:hypothetical protein
VQKGQAEAFYLCSPGGPELILKKFYPSRTPDRPYLEAIGSLLPAGDTFACGKERHVLLPDSLEKASGHYHSRELAAWLGDVLLMPRIDGADWAALADEL